MTLREQIETLREWASYAYRVEDFGSDQWGIPQGAGHMTPVVLIDRDAVLDIIDQHHCDERYETFTASDGEVSVRKHVCIPDRDALARALEVAAHDEGHHYWCRFNEDCGLYGDSQPFADAIITALKEQVDAKD